MSDTRHLYETIAMQFDGHELFHASLDAEEYERLLSAHRFEVLLHRVEDPQCGKHTVWLAQQKLCCITKPGDSSVSLDAPLALRERGWG